jgi:hypothetical protein
LTRQLRPDSGGGGGHITESGSCRQPHRTGITKSWIAVSLSWRPVPFRVAEHTFSSRACQPMSPNRTGPQPC